MHAEHPQARYDDHQEHDHAEDQSPPCGLYEDDAANQEDQRDQHGWPANSPEHEMNPLFIPGFPPPSCERRQAEQEEGNQGAPLASVS
jgi:hypothetical protein